MGPCSGMTELEDSKWA